MKGTTSSETVVMRFCPPTITIPTMSAIPTPTTQGLISKAVVSATVMEFACTILPVKPT